MNKIILSLLIVSSVVVASAKKPPRYPCYLKRVKHSLNVKRLIGKSVAVAQKRKVRTPEPAEDNQGD